MIKSRFFAAAILAAITFQGVAAAKNLPDHDIVILYTNDVHCGIDDKIGYAGLSLYKEEMKEVTPYVTLADAGDAIQGATVGSLSAGGYIITLMNQTGYDVAIPGNHEFDYGMKRFMELSKKLECGYISCNFTGKNKKRIFPAYKIFNYGNTKVAFVGVTTPDTLTSSTPIFFQDKKGNYIYDFGGADDGKPLFENCQKAIDDARNEGADFVIILAHLGENAPYAKWSAINLIANTSGADALIDGHSHETTPHILAKNKDGIEIPVTQSGTKLNNIGKLVISKDGSILTDLVTQVPQKNGSNRDEKIAKSIEDIKNELSIILDKKYGESDFDLPATDESGHWYVRNKETNLCDFITDAFKASFNSEIAFINAGGIRKTLKKGELTYNDILSVQPFSNKICLYKIPGQTILDELEFGARKLPDLNGGLLHSSGLSYKIDTSIPSSVETDEKGFFTGNVKGPYRVHDVMINGKPLDVKKIYTVAINNYTGSYHGDGHLFKDAKIPDTQNNKTDADILIEYLKSLNGKIPEEYRDWQGQKRLIIE